MLIVKETFFLILIMVNLILENKKKKQKTANEQAKTKAQASKPTKTLATQQAMVMTGNNHRTHQLNYIKQYIYIIQKT